MFLQPYSEKILAENRTSFDDFQLRRLIQQEKFRRAALNNSSAITEFSSVIPGLRNVFYKRRFIACKVFWFIFILTCLGVCGYQTVDRISFYFSYPIKTEIKIEYPKKFSFPAITLCARHSDKINKLISVMTKGLSIQMCVEGYWLFVNKTEGRDANEFWKMSEALPEFNITLYSKNGRKSDVSVDATSVDLISGKCFTIEIKDEVEFEGQETILKVMRQPMETKCLAFGILLSFHEPGGFVNIRNCLFADQGGKTQIAIAFKRFKRLNTPNKLCVSSLESEECYKNCITNAIEKANFSCKTPAIPLKNLPVCADSKDTKNTHDVIWKLLYEADRQHYCNCTRTCDEKIYSFIRIPDRFGGSVTELNFFYPSNKFHVVEEIEAYSFISLVCDIGGNLGLYLGLSVISFFELFESLVALCNFKKGK